MLQERTMTRRKPTRRREIERAPGPTPERMAKAGEAFEVGHHGTITLRDSPLEWLERRGSKNGISPAQYNAGVKYRHHWHFSGMLPNIGTIDLNRIFAGNGGNIGMPSSESQAHHRQQYRAAQDAVGMQVGRLLDNVICLEFSVVDAGRILGWRDEKQARAAAISLLRVGLDKLRAMWGLS
jgi:hypothetical protein